MSYAACPKTGKRCYGSKRMAREATKNVSNKIRVYICPHCHSFHVTSKTGG